MKDAITNQIADGATRLKLGIEREPRLWPQTTLVEGTVHLSPDQRIANVHEPSYEVSVIPDLRVPQVEDVQWSAPIRRVGCAAAPNLRGPRSFEEFESRFHQHLIGVPRGDSCRLSATTGAT